MEKTTKEQTENTSTEYEEIKIISAILELLHLV